MMNKREHTWGEHASDAAAGVVAAAEGLLCCRRGAKELVLYVDIALEMRHQVVADFHLPDHAKFGKLWPDIAEEVAEVIVELSVVSLGS